MIRMISGTTRIGNKYYNASDGAFEADEHTESRLVSRGVAEYVGKGVAMPLIGEETTTSGVNKPEDKNRAEDAVIALSGEEDIPGTARPKYDRNTKASELREIGKKYGISFSVGTSKDKMIEQLDAFFVDYFADAPTLSVEEPLE